MKKTAFIVFLLIMGCSSVREMRGSQAVPVGEKAVDNLKITFEPVSELSLETYRLFNVYFRNLNEEWLQVKNVDIVDVSGAPHFKVVVSDDLKAWRKSMSLDVDLRIEHEKDPALRARLFDMKSVLDKYKEDDYVYARFRLPAMLQTQKWLLLQTPQKEKIKAITVRLTFMDESKQVYLVKPGVKP